MVICNCFFSAGAVAMFSARLRPYTYTRKPPMGSLTSDHPAGGPELLGPGFLGPGGPVGPTGTLGVTGGGLGSGLPVSAGLFFLQPSASEATTSTAVRATVCGREIIKNLRAKIPEG